MFVFPSQVASLNPPEASVGTLILVPADADRNRVQTQPFTCYPSTSIKSGLIIIVIIYLNMAAVNEL